ncbi:MAG: glycosyltransferase family 9 protein [Ignavibacteria bacterium]|nr:glycosyltransferase family 9 protein [Ignavibacteria bacterium]
MKNLNPDEIKKILLIKPRGIGDVVLSTIIIDNLINYFKNCKIHYLVEPFVKPAIEFIPQIDKIITFERNEFVLNVIKKIRREKYDIIFDLWTNPKTAQITFLSGAKYRVGFSYRGRKYAYNIKATSERGKHHSAEHNLELLKPLSIPIVSKKILFGLDENKKFEAQKFKEASFNRDKSIIGILPSGSWKSKRVDKEKWVEIIRVVLEKYQAQIFIIWGPGDEDDAEYIKAQVYDDVIIAPKTDLQLMSAMINFCDFILANDSGPMHIADALGVRVLGIFGPTNPKTHRPYSNELSSIYREDLDCLVCNKLECPFNHECILDLPTEKILDRIELIAGDVLKRRY